jgi:hypothetical protein
LLSLTYRTSASSLSKLAAKPLVVHFNEIDPTRAYQVSDSLAKSRLSKQTCPKVGLRRPRVHCHSVSVDCVEDGHCPNVGSNWSQWQPPQFRNSTTYGTPVVGKQSALPTSVRTASLVPADLEMTAKHVFLVLLDLEVTPSDFSSLKAASSRLPPFPSLFFQTDCCPHQGIAHRSAQ